MKLGLEAISALAAALGHPERRFRSVIIAGTNGKGSVAAMVHRGLVAAGRRAARYTSPHLERLEERFVIGTREVTTAELEAAADTVRLAVDGLVRDGVLQAPPTFFECVTAAAFVLFERAQVEIAVLEVGLGGRLDATNIVTPLAAAITSIDFDHQAQLGSTLEAIAYEKAGVIKPGIPVVCGELPPAAQRIVEDVCADRGARPVRAASCVDVDAVTAGEPLALRGTHQRGNAAVAACLLRQLSDLGLAVEAAAIEAALVDVTWPGRLEILRRGQTEVLLDAAHNPAGAEALARFLRDEGWTGCALVFGAMQDKDIAGMLAPLAGVCGAIVCTTPDSPRALPAEAAAALARGTAGAVWRVEAAAAPSEALRRAADESPRVVVAGSIFLIGPLRGILRAQ
jgi:dihydrofolate synthase / folylpolyglutamate synthase